MSEGHQKEDFTLARIDLQFANILAEILCLQV